MNKLNQTNPNKKKSLKDFISESTFYKDSASKQIFLSDPENLGAGFMFSFMGLLGLLNGSKNKKVIVNHFKSDKQLRLANISDDNNNTSLILKLMEEEDAFISSSVVNELTRFLVIMKGGRIDTVKDDLIRAVVKGIKSTFISSHFDGKLKSILKDFTDNAGSLHELTTRLLKVKSAYPVNITSEFVSLARLSSFEEAKDMKKLAGVDDEEEKKLDVRETQKLPSKDLVREALLNRPGYLSELLGNKSISDFEKKLLAIVCLSVNPVRASTSNPLAMLVKNSIFSNNLFDGYKHELEAILPPAVKDLSKSDLDDILWDMNPISFPRVSKFEQYLRQAILKRKSEFLDKLINPDSGSRSFSMRALFDIFGEKNILAEFGSYRQMILDIEKTYQKEFKNAKPRLLYRIFARMIGFPGFEKERDLICEISFSLLAKLVEEKEELDDDFTDIWARSDLISLSKKVSDKSVEPHIIKITNVLRKIKDKGPMYFPKFVEQVGILRSYVKGATEDDKSGDSTFVKLLLKHLTPLELAALPQKEKINLGQLVDLARKTVVTTGNIDQVLPALIDKIEPPIDVDKRIQLFKMVLNNPRQMMKDVATSQEAISFFEKSARLIGITEKAELNRALSSFEFNIFSNGLSFPQRTQKEKDLMIDLAIYHDKNKLEDSDLNLRLYAARDIFVDVSEEQAEKLLNAFVNNPNGYLARMFSKDNIKTISRREDKSKIKDFYFGLLFDNIERHPDLVDRFYENMEPALQNQVRSQLLATGGIKGIINKGPIFPQEDISNQRMKEILSFNNIDIEAGLTKLKLSRKSKNQTITQYIAATKPVIDELENSVLGKLKVAEIQSSKMDLAKRTVELVNSTYAGRHGNIYPKILRSFSVALPTEMYDKFTKEMAEAGVSNEHILPAFHGTGGIAASMILRYGFKVISASDPSVTGRMLGNFDGVTIKRPKNSPDANWELSTKSAKKDLANYEYNTADLGGGIYFAINIDKSLQYVGNSGYARTIGTKGYIFVMDAQLGVENEHYRAAGLGNDAIRSPEWAVAGGNSQLKILIAHEVELVDHRTYSDLKQTFGESYEKGISFKSFYRLNEAVVQPSSNQQRFIFWDGNIPLLNGKVVPFEEVKSLGKRDVTIEITPNGPAVVFYNTKETVTHDVRYASAMKDPVSRLYYGLLRSRQG